MDALRWFPAGQSSRRVSLHRSNDHDGLIGCDTAPPNHRAQRRGFIVILMVAGVVAVVAVTFGMLQGLLDMLGAFPTGASIFELGAWDRFFTGVGRVTTLALLCAAVVMVLRWRNRRAKRVRAK